MRRRLLGILLLPLLALIFFIGWLMYFFGDKKTNSNNFRRTRKKDSIKFGLLQDLVEEEIDQQA